MAIMPGADWQGEHGTSLMSAYDILCVHTIVGNPPAHAAHFSTRADGWLYQSRDTRYRSAANLNGNYRVIAVENDDHGPEYGSWGGSDVPRFTAAQAWTLVQLILWCHATHGIPIELVPDSKPGRRGIAYHRQGCDGNFGGYAYPGRVAGGELWSSAFGKVCPGDRRISQLINEIIPRARELAGLSTEDDLAGEGPVIINALYKGGNIPGAIANGSLWGRVTFLERMVWAGGPVPGEVAEGTLVDDVNKMKEQLNRIESALTALAADKQAYERKPTS